MANAFAERIRIRDPDNPNKPPPPPVFNAAPQIAELFARGTGKGIVNMGSGPDGKGGGGGK